MTRTWIARGGIASAACRALLGVGVLAGPDAGAPLPSGPYGAHALPKPAMTARPRNLRRPITPDSVYAGQEAGSTGATAQPCRRECVAVPPQVRRKPAEQLEVASALALAPLAAALFGQLMRFPTLRRQLADVELASPVRAVGPFGRATRYAAAARTLLVGDAADFYDPFTGEGVYAALAGAELAAEYAVRGLESDRLGANDLAGYDRARRRAFAAKWALERIVSWVVSRPRVLGHVAARLARRPELADRLVSVTAHVAPPSSVLRPSFAWQLAC